MSIVLNLEFEIFWERKKTMTIDFNVWMFLILSRKKVEFSSKISILLEKLLCSRLVDNYLLFRWQCTLIQNTYRNEKRIILRASGLGWFYFYSFFTQTYTHTHTHLSTVIVIESIQFLNRWFTRELGIHYVYIRCCCLVMVKNLFHVLFALFWLMSIHFIPFVLVLFCVYLN